MPDGPIRRPSGAPIRVFLVDDHEVVLDGLRLLIGSQPDMEVVGEATTCAAALGRIGSARPDVAVVDLRLPDGDGMTLCRDMRARGPVRCIILTAEADREALRDAAVVGADALLLKTVRGTELGAAIREVAAGRSMLDESLVSLIDEHSYPRELSNPALASLSSREREVLELLGEGLSNRQIADRLFLAEKTVKNYVSNVLMKLGLQRRAEAAVLVVRMEQQRSPRLPALDVDYPPERTAAT